MENQKNDNLNLLQAVVQNTEMGKNTLEQIVPMTEEPRFKAELLRQRNIYRELNQEAHTAITACGGTAQTGCEAMPAPCSPEDCASAGRAGLMPVACSDRPFGVRSPEIRAPDP